MARVDVEDERGSRVLIAGVAGRAFGAVTWWHLDFCTGAFAFLGVGIALIFGQQLWSQV